MKEEKKKVIDYLVRESEGEWTKEELSAMSNFELFDAYLTWEGIIGYTEKIMETVENIWNVKLP